jgi:glycosyltransferase involved in cell wall biosynthesis
MSKLKIINFSSSGGIKQFTDHLLKNCFNKIEIINSNNLKEIFLYLKLNKNDSTFLFTNNNLKIYLCLFFMKFDSILILHDHVLRNNANLREKVLHYFVFKNINKFKKVIIHENNKDLLNKYPNMQYLKMPYHNTIKEESSGQKINLLFFGRIEKYKNINIIIKSFQNKDIANKFNLIIAGKGNIDNEIIPLLKNTNITLINQFIDDTLRDILIDWSHYFILPYDSITQTGLVDLAGSYKKPSIVSNIDGFKDYNSKNFKNVLNINNQELFNQDLLEIYNDFFINYEYAQKEAYEIFQKSNNEWKNYKSFLEESY